jgi:hypothetical protein
VWISRTAAKPDDISAGLGECSLLAETAGRRVKSSARAKIRYSLVVV